MSLSHSHPRAVDQVRDVAELRLLPATAAQVSLAPAQAAAATWDFRNTLLQRPLG